MRLKGDHFYLWWAFNTNIGQFPPLYFVTTSWKKVIWLLVAQFAKKIYLAGKLSKKQWYGGITCKECLQKQYAKNSVPAWKIAKNHWLLQLAHQREPSLHTISENWNSNPNPETHLNQTEHQCCIVRFARCYPKFCIGFKIRKSRSEQLLLSGSGHSKWFSSAALKGVMWDWVEQ